MFCRRDFRTLGQRDQLCLVCPGIFRGWMHDAMPMQCPRRTVLERRALCVLDWMDRNDVQLMRCGLHHVVEWCVRCLWTRAMRPSAMPWPDKQALLW